MGTKPAESKKDSAVKWFCLRRKIKRGVMHDLLALFINDLVNSVYVTIDKLKRI